MYGCFKFFFKQFGYNDYLTNFHWSLECYYNKRFLLCMYRHFQSTKELSSYRTVHFSTFQQCITLRFNHVVD